MFTEDVKQYNNNNNCKRMGHSQSLAIYTQFHSPFYELWNWVYIAVMFIGKKSTVPLITLGSVFRYQAGVSMTVLHP